MTLPIVPPEAITTDWLTRALAAGGVRARVRDFTTRRIGTGQIGQSLRFELAYDAAPPGAPASLVGKFPAPEPDSRNTGVVLGNYRREVNFYNHLAVSDVAYFLAGALKRDERRKVERELLAEYHQHLGELGVRYDFERLWTDYRSRAFALFLVGFYAAMLVTQTPRGDEMFLAMVRGSTEQVLDLDSLTFLD